MHRSYVPREWVDSYLIHEQEELPRDVAARFFSVLRIKSDEKVAVFDGRGREVVGLLERVEPHKGARFVRARMREETRALPALVVVQAALEEPKLCQTIQRGTEFGVDRFMIFSAVRSEKFCFTKLEKRKERLNNIAQDAARQSGRMFIPEVDFVAKLDDIIAMAKGSMSIGVYGDVTGREHLSRLLKVSPLSDAPCYIAVGPEGGLSPDETTKLRAHGFNGVLWAPHVLRAELACLSAVAIINSFCGRA